MGAEHHKNLTELPHKVYVQAWDSIKKRNQRINKGRQEM